jgi:hypothetical protein
VATLAIDLLWVVRAGREEGGRGYSPGACPSSLWGLGGASVDEDRPTTSRSKWRWQRSVGFVDLLWVD